MTGVPLPSELLLLSPGARADPAFEELLARLTPVLAPVPVRIVRGDGAGDAPPRSGAALVAGGQPGTAVLLQAMQGRNKSEPEEGGAGWSWVHLLASGPDPFAGWVPIMGDPLLTYSRGVNARSVAEWCLGAILYLVRDFGPYTRGAPEGRWERRWARELGGCRLLVLGAGSAGEELAKLASALGLHTAGVSRSGTPRAGFDRMVRREDRESVWGEADVTVVLLPRGRGTLGMIGKERIEGLKPGSLLVVASRGGIVDEEALLEAVRSGHLAGAALDVFAEEPLSADSPLRHEPRILLTPHVAGTTDRFMERNAEVLTHIWLRWFQGKDPGGIDVYRYHPEADE